MTRPPYSRPEPGQALVVHANEYGDAIQAGRQLRQNGGELPGMASGPAGTQVIVENTTGATVDEYSALGITGLIYDPTSITDLGQSARGLFMTGAAIDADAQRDQLVITQEPIPAGGLGRAVMVGATLARVDVQDEADGYALAQDGSGELKSNPNGGAAILAKGSGTGVVWAWVDLTGYRASARTYWATITGAVSTTGNQTIYNVAEAYPRAGTGLAAFAAVTGGRTGTALCVAEASNTGTLAGAVSTASGAYPAGFGAVRIPNGTVVRVHEVVQDAGTVLGVFQHGHTAHDGTCT